MKMNLMQAINKAIDEEMARDERVVLIGEDVGSFGGCFGVTQGLYDKYGPERVIDFPIAENTLVGATVGMALGGMKVVSELMFADFAEIAFDEILNKMGKWKCRSYFVFPPVCSEAPDRSTLRARRPISFTLRDCTYWFLPARQTLWDFSGQRSAATTPACSSSTKYSTA